MSENGKKSVIGFWGYPPPELIKKIKQGNPSAKWVYLDIDLGAEDKRILPDSYCKIVKNIINNSFKFKDDLITILAPIGKDKCDSGWFASEVLKDLGFPVIPTIFEDISQRKEIKISTSNLPLRQKFELITGNIVEEQHLSIRD